MASGTRCLFKHIPVPFVDLAAFEAEALVQLRNLLLCPLGIFLELVHEDLVLNCVFPKTFLDLLCSLGSVSDDDPRD